MSDKPSTDEQSEPTAEVAVAEPAPHSSTVRGLRTGTKVGLAAVVIGVGALGVIGGALMSVEGGHHDRHGHEMFRRHEMFRHHQNGWGEGDGPMYGGPMNGGNMQGGPMQGGPMNGRQGPPPDAPDAPDAPTTTAPTN